MRAAKIKNITGRKPLFLCTDSCLSLSESHLSSVGQSSSVSQCSCKIKRQK